MKGKGMPANRALAYRFMPTLMKIWTPIHVATPTEIVAAECAAERMATHQVSLQTTNEKQGDQGRYTDSPETDPATTEKIKITLRESQAGFCRTHPDSSLSKPATRPTVMRA